MSAYGLGDTNLFAYCRNNPVKNGDDNGCFVNTVIGAVVGGLVAAITTDKSDPNYVEKVALGALTGAVSGLAVDVAIATGGVGAIAIAAAGGAISNGLNSYATQKMDYGTANAKYVLIDAAIGAGLNTLSYGISIPKNRITAGGSLITRIIQNSNNAIVSGAVKTVTTKGVTSTVYKTAYRTILAKNIVASYTTSSVVSFSSWAYSGVAKRMVK